MIVLDTHALIWWLADSTKLTAGARKAIQVSAANNEVLVSAASVLEIATLVRRERLVLANGFEQWLDDVCSLPEVQIVPVSTEIAARAGSFGAEVHGDPIDRLIIATAQVVRARLVTADTNIRSSKVVATVW